MRRIDPSESRPLERAGQGGSLRDLAAIALATITAIVILTSLADDLYRLYVAIFVGAR